MEFERTRKIKMHLDIAPLIDIVFLLLIFFMLTANFMMQPGIKITLPGARSAKPQEKPKVVIFISESNDVYLDQHSVALPDLKRALQNKLEQFKQKMVVVKADEKINLGLTVQVMDIAKEAGFENVVISTERPKKNGTDSKIRER